MLWLAIYTMVAMIWLVCLLSQESEDPPIVALFAAIGSAVIWPILLPWCLWSVYCVATKEESD